MSKWAIPKFLLPCLAPRHVLVFGTKSQHELDKDFCTQMPNFFIGMKYIAALVMHFF